MERRDLLQMGGLLGITALGGGAACLPRSLPRRIPDSEVDKILGTMDASLEQISRYDTLDDFTKRANTKAKYTDDDRMLTQASVRSLYTSAFFRNLPEDAQMHPAVQERVFGQLASMDDAVFGMTDRMSTLSEDRREFVRAALHDKKTDPEKVSEVFDRGMGALAMPVGRRFQARSIFSQVGFRMKKHPALVIDEYVTKVQKATAFVGSKVELQRRVAAQMGQEAYWRRQNQLALMLADDPGGPGGGLAPPGGPVGPVAPQPQVDNSAEVQMLMTNIRYAAARNECETVQFLGRRIADLDPETYRNVYLTDGGVIACKQTAAQQRADATAARSPADCSEGDARSRANKIARDKVIGTGGWMLGISLVTGVLGAILVNGSEGAAVLGAIGLTVGVSLLIGGLIVVIVGAGMASS